MSDNIDIDDWFREHVKLPGGWQRIKNYQDGEMWRNKRKSLLVGASIMAYGDGNQWLHVSVSRKDKLTPTWQDMCNAKDAFIGRSRKAIQVHPEKSKYVNIHRACLHLWHCLDTDPLPEFSNVLVNTRVI